MSAVFGVSDEFVTRLAALDPAFATRLGIPGHDDEVIDPSPAGIAERDALYRSTLADLDAAEIDDDDDRIAAAVLSERLNALLRQSEAQEDLRPLRPIGSPVQTVRSIFDLMPASTDDEWATIARRMAGVPAALEGLTESLRLGLSTGVVAARRQALACAAQARAWAGLEPGLPSFFADFAGSYRGASHTLAASLADAADVAAGGYGALAAFLTDEYAPRAPEVDAVGRDRYAVRAAYFLGADIDLDETYQWGLDELARLEAEMVEVAGRITPGATVPEVIASLEESDELAIEGVDAFRSWLQDLMDATVASLNGAHFDIPEPLQRVEAMIAPAGGAAAMYYTAPSEDFRRPGRTWYPTQGRTTFPLWGEVSIAYHEGVPGHHLQIATAVLRADRLSRYQRSISISGHGEGWALYAERLMAELGYFEKPWFYLGFLRAQAFRAMRVVVDIGLHTGQQPPGFAKWDYESAVPYVLAHGWMPEPFLLSEVDRYLGMPGQAISYKVGERVWLEARAAAQTAPKFDLRAWHQRALDLGPMGLDLLRHELV